MSDCSAQFLLRRAVQSDADEIAAIWLRSRRAAVPAIPPPVHTDDEVRIWIAEVVLPAEATWVIEHAGRAVAMLVLDAGLVDQLYVDPDYTGQGLGARLLNLAKDQSPGGLDLWTFQGNIGARGFYERHGFAAVAMTDGDNEERCPDVRYHWQRDSPR
jgi:GNAT superfamily N-acetyltransferase